MQVTDPEKSIYIESWGGGDVVLYDGPEKIGFVKVDIIKGNVVITVERLDEERFGPVSLVVV